MNVVSRNCVRMANVRRSFRAVTKAAGVGEDWTPREMRHSFVSILSGDGTTIEKISHLSVDLVRCCSAMRK